MKKLKHSLEKKMVEWLVCKDYKQDDIYSLYKKKNKTLEHDNIVGHVN